MNNISMKNKSLTELLDIRHSIIMAPMFLVTSTKMMKEALNAGIAACMPALNFRTDKDLREAIEDIRSNTTSKGLGVNLIVNKSNLKMMQQLKTCVELKVDFIITSLGNPEQVIELCKPNGIRIFCDVVEENYAKKVEKLGADALIAVNKYAGGHAGFFDSKELISRIREVCSIPIIAAGGVGTRLEFEEKINEGYSGLSIGSPFIACEEAEISIKYKQACVDYGKKDIVFTTKISGTPCTVINTPYVQQTGTKQNFLENLISKNKKLKKWIKMIIYLKGMKSIKKAAFSNTYKTVWCAGPSIEHTSKILPIKEIIKRLTI
jgi:nitronate monooxygenase